jgi:hypothetical protein
VSSNREQIKETLAALGSMPYGPLEEASGVPSGSFGRALRELVQAGEVERVDSSYQLPVNEALLFYCARCDSAHRKPDRAAGETLEDVHNNELAAS